MMSFQVSALALIVLPALVAGMGGCTYTADFGKYGKFRLKTSNDDSKMGMKINLANMDEFEGVDAVAFHLHTKWTHADKAYATGGELCGGGATGGHYDPFLACGPASAAALPNPDTSSLCYAIYGNYRDQYSCSGAYEAGEYAKCEVGDLTGKYGTVEVESNGKAKAKFKRDPLPALDYHYEENYSENDYDKFSSIVIHKATGERILCGKLVKDE